MSVDCTFCQIVSGEAPADTVAEDELTVAFLDRSQATDGHTLVVPRLHATDIWRISERDASATMLMAQRVALRVDQRLSPEGLNLIQANRPAGWQTVFHFHIHVIPRWAGDGLTPPWTPEPTSAERLADILVQLR